MTYTRPLDVIGCLYLKAIFTKQLFPTYTHSEQGAMLSAETYKGEEDMSSVLTPGKRGRHVHQ